MYYGWGVERLNADTVIEVGTLTICSWLDEQVKDRRFDRAVLSCFDPVFERMGEKHDVTGKTLLVEQRFGLLLAADPSDFFDI